MSVVNIGPDKRQDLHRSPLQCTVLTYWAEQHSASHSDSGTHSDPGVLLSILLFSISMSAFLFSFSISTDNRS